MAAALRYKPLRFDGKQLRGTRKSPEKLEKIGVL